jgi:hypothetical protein
MPWHRRLLINTRHQRAGGVAPQTATSSCANGLVWPPRRCPGMWHWRTAHCVRLQGALARSTLTQQGGLQRSPAAARPARRHSHHERCDTALRCRSSRHGPQMMSKYLRWTGGEQAWPGPRPLQAQAGGVQQHRAAAAAGSGGMTEAAAAALLWHRAHALPVPTAGSARRMAAEPAARDLQTSGSETAASSETNVTSNVWESEVFKATAAGPSIHRAS